MRMLSSNRCATPFAREIPCGMWALISAATRCNFAIGSVRPAAWSLLNRRPGNAQKLTANVAEASNCLIMPIALGDRNEPVRFTLNFSTTTHHVQRLNAPSPTAVDHITVPMTTGDAVASSLSHVPNVIKIDAEGHEEEVLQGLSVTLDQPQVRTLFVEIHFGILEQRGQPLAPLRIERFLQSKRFTTSWMGRSHLKAERA